MEVRHVVGRNAETSLAQGAGQRQLAGLSLAVPAKGTVTATLTVPDTWCTAPGTYVWFGIKLPTDEGLVLGGVYTVAVGGQRVPITLERTFEADKGAVIEAVWSVSGPGVAWTGLNAPPQLRLVCW